MVKSFDHNDYSYGVYKADSNRLAVIRDVVPEWQLCFLKTGEAPGVLRAFKMHKNEYVYELAFPLPSLSPIKLDENTSFGFSVLVNKIVDGIRAGRTIMPAGLEPYNNSDKWATIILNN